MCAGCDASGGNTVGVVHVALFRQHSAAAFAAARDRKSSKEMPVTVLVDERPVTTGDSLSYPLIDIIVPDTGFDRRPSRAVDSDATATEGTSVTSDDELAA